MVYALIQVYMDYDYCEAVSCLGSFPTAEAAELRRTEMMDAEKTALLKRLEYVDNYVKSINIPEAPTNQEWQELLAQWYGDGPRWNGYHKDFRDVLRARLISGYGIKIPTDFSPPALAPSAQNLFVVAVP